MVVRSKAVEAVGGRRCWGGARVGLLGWSTVLGGALVWVAVVGQWVVA